VVSWKRLSHLDPVWSTRLPPAWDPVVPAGVWFSSEPFSRGDHALSADETKKRTVSRVSPFRAAGPGHRKSVTRALTVATVAALAVALSAADRDERREPAWIAEICAEVTTC